MYKDYTIKAKIASGKSMEEKLHLLGAQYMGTDQQTDTYFKVARGKLKLRQGTMENLITHYERTPEGDAEKTQVYRYDVNPSQEEIEKLMRSYSVIGTVQKQRKIYFIDHIKIHVDQLQNEEEFIELEAIDRDNKFSNEELKRHCLELKVKLGIQESDQLQTGYLNA